MAIPIKIISSKSRGAHEAPKSSPRQGGSSGAGARRKKKGMSGGGKAAVVIIALLVILIGVFVGFGFAAKARDTVYPNVSVSGVEVGGMTEAEAEAALLAAGFDNYSGTAVRVEFTDEIAVDVTSEAAGVGMDLASAAREAYAYGRDGGFFGNAMKYISCLLGAKQLELGGAFTIDEAYVRNLISGASVTLLSGGSEECSISDTSITLIKSASGLSIDEDEVYALIYKAFESHDYATISYEPKSSDDGTMDMQALRDSIFKEPVSAYYDKETDAIVPSVTGVSFDAAAAQHEYDAAGNGERIVIDLILTEPEVTTESLESTLFCDLLASKTTTLTSNTGRSKNIELASAEVNETVLMPGEVFDYNTVVGERTTARGFSAAASYRGKEVVQEVGGGICQVSSTIYYATLYARLETVYRTCHRYASSYVPLGMDATVSWGGPEFKFKNSSDAPVKIIAYINWNGDYRQSVTVELWGTKWDDNYVEMSYTYTGAVAFSTEYVDDPELPAGTEEVETSGYAGTAVDTYRSVYDKDGNLLYTEFIDSSAYAGRDAVIRRGTGEVVSPSPSESPTTDPTAPPSESPSADPSPSESPADTPPVESVTP